MSKFYGGISLVAESIPSFVDMVQPSKPTPVGDLKDFDVVIRESSPLDEVRLINGRVCVTVLNLEPVSR